MLTNHIDGRADAKPASKLVWGNVRRNLTEFFGDARDARTITPGSNPAMGPGGWANANLRTTFEKIVRRAGLTTWPRLFHNLRASRETELAETNSVQSVTSLLGEHSGRGDASLPDNDE